MPAAAGAQGTTPPTGDGTPPGDFRPASLAFWLLLAWIIGLPGALGQSTPPDTASNQLLVRFRPEVSPARREALLKSSRVNLTTARLLPEGGSRVPAGRFSSSVLANVALVEAGDPVKAQEAAAEIAAHAEVLYVEPNYRLRIFSGPSDQVVPSDFEFGAQWGLLNTGQGEGESGNDIRATEAWPVVTNARQVRVAVIDTGIDYYHPDLEANVWLNPAEIPGNGLDDDGNGYVDDLHGYDFVSDDGDPMDDQSHGSHVAGIIGAVGNNRIGVAGVCWEASLMAIKAFDEHGEGTVAGVASALRYAVENGARIINASWGQSDKSRVLQEAITEAWDAGVLIVAAAGNERDDIAPFPAGYDPVVAVGALNVKGERAVFSNFGAYVDLAAPGEAVLATTPNGRYDLLSGTSMAAPHASGVAALVLAGHPEFTNNDLAAILRNCVSAIHTDQYLGTGRLDAGKAVRVRKPLPRAKLSLPKVISGRVDLRGTAAGPDFASYRLEYGSGTYPTNWTRFHEATQAVEEGALFKDFSSAQLQEGTFSIRLVVSDTLGQEAEDRVVATVRNVHLTSPANNDVVRRGDRVTLQGTVFGNGRRYVVEHGVGLEPSTWSVVGIELENAGQSEVFSGVLGTWDTTAAEPSTFHALRLRAFEGTALVGEWRTMLVYVDDQLRPGWPVHLPATGVHPTNDWRHVTIADLDADGVQEILRVQPGSPPGAPSRLMVFAPDGAVRWSRELAAGDPPSDIPLVGDLDDDGRLEVFVDAGEEQRLFAFRHDGADLGGPWPLTLPASAPGKVLADLDRDGRPELIGLANASDKPPQLFVLDAAGNLRASWPVETCWAGPSWPRRFPAVGNFDEDRQLEIVAPMGCSRIGLFDLNEPSGPVWVREVPGQILASPVTGDLDGDGRDEVLVPTYDPYAVAGRGVQGGLYAWTTHGELFPGWPVKLDLSFATPPALADVDGDGDLEIAIASGGVRELHLLHHDGFNAPGWPVSVAPIPSLNSAPVLADVTGDGRPEVVAAVPGLLGPVLFTGNFQTVGTVRAWNPGGVPVALHPRPDWPGLFLESGGNFSRFKAAQVIITDLDRNGLADLVASSIDDTAYAATPPISTRKERYSLYAWELPVAATASATGWPMFQRDPQHTGYQESVSATNHPPVLYPPPSQTVRSGSPFFAIDLRGYAEDPDHAFRDLDWQIHGAVELQAAVDGQGVLTVAAPQISWMGSEPLTLTVTDPEGAQASATVYYAARPDYTPPLARSDEVVISEDTAADIAVLANDEHPWGLALRVESHSRPRRGKLQRRGGERLDYTPDPDFNGTDSFDYMVVDGEGGMALASVGIRVTPVPDAPVAKPDHVVLDEDAMTEIEVLANDADPDLDPLYLSSFVGATNGRVELVGAARLRFTPKADWSGNDGFQYVITDGSGLSATGAVQLVVRPVNDAPTAEDQQFTMNRNTSVDVFYRAADPDGSTLSYQVLEGPRDGELWTYPDIATYYPRRGFAGEDGFSYLATDGSLTSRVARVTFRVLDANNPPKSESVALATRLNRPLTLSLTATDEDGDHVTFEIVSPPEHGEINRAGTNFVYTPARDFLGVDSLMFRAFDGHDYGANTLAEITVTDKNTAPVAKGTTVEVRMNTPTNLVLRAIDGEGDPLRFTVLTNPVSGVISGDPPTLVYAPAQDYVGPDRLSFRASDDEFDSAPATVTLHVVPLNRMPLASNQTVRLPANQPTTLVFDLRDPDGDALRVAILKGPRQGRLFGLGTNFVYAPKSGASGYDSFTYKAWDGRIYSEVRTVGIELEAPPPAPAPRFEAIEWLETSRSVRLRLHAESAGGELQIQRSTTLTNWTTLSTLTPTGGAIELLDTNAPPGPAVFYRAVRY